MKILLLGAAGFIGTNLTIELAKKTEDEITLVDRSKAFFKPIVSMDLKNVHILEADLTVDMDFDSILKDQEVVYHLVSTTVPTTSNQHISQELVSNVIFSANLFEACIRCGVKKVVFVSSGGTVSLTSILIPRCLSQVVLDQMNRVLLLVPICGLDWSLGKESYICLVAGIDIGIYFHHEPKG